MRTIRQKRWRLSGLLALVALSALGVAAGIGTAAKRAAPSNVSQPTIDGTAVEGQTLTANAGTWRGTEPIRYSARWLRCDVGGGGCAGIAGANDATYKLAQADVGHTIRVAVTASNTDGQATARSRPTATVKPAPQNAPSNTSAPTISGNAAEGQTLAGDAGDWEGTKPIDFNYQWQRCDNNGLACANISGGTGKTYTVSSADVGNTIRLRVTATNSAGRTVAFSRPTGVVTGKTPPPPPSGGSIPVSNVNPPQRLVIAQAQFSPNPLRSRSDLITARFRILDTRGNVVRGALVFAIPLPYGWTTQPPEVASEANGWATVTMRATRSLPRRGAIVMFVRARKPGDPVLTGVSNRRLVQMLVSLG